MKKVYLLFETDQWHSTSSKELVFAGDCVAKCCKAACKRGATEEQVIQLQEMRQSLYNNDCEYEIKEWEVNGYEV